MDLGVSAGAIFAAIIVLIYLSACIRVIKEYQRGVMFFLGRYSGVKGPGLRFVLAPVFRIVIIDLRTMVQNVPEQEVITRDNVSAKVNAVFYFRVIEPDRAVLQVGDYLYATSQLAQTTMRAVIGAHELDELLAQREKLNATIQAIVDEKTEPWGIKVASVEIKDVEVPADMRRIMARQAEAERERRAKVIAAEGEFQAAQRYADAARVLATQPGTMQLRDLETLVAVAAEHNSTTIFPFPLEFLRVFTRVGSDSPT
jgi:regulator of protease activity HflC (stomatin/prohibitin superfamily)